MGNWADCKNILVIRADNMGDVLMSFPAIGALRNTIKAKLTLLTSGRGSDVAKLNPDVDNVISSDLPWVKTNNAEPGEQIAGLVHLLKNYQFDGCVIFTVYSQSPLPAAMLAYITGIPLRLAYCRENPYGLLTDWVPDPEPYELIRHQVKRDLDLVAAIGSFTTEHNISLTLPPEAILAAEKKLGHIGLDMRKPYLLLHPGVSEQKREYPFDSWIKCAVRLISEFNMPLLFTGNVDEAPLLDALKSAVGNQAHTAGGLFSLPELAAAIDKAAVVISVNTGTVHLAAALQTPVVVLYARTNPQHKPWMVPNVVLEYSIPGGLKSRNKIIEFVDKKLYCENIPVPDEFQVTESVRNLLLSENNETTSLNTSL
jgi:ADP-heptose:LPS heptosyltransferase